MVGEQIVLVNRTPEPLTFVANGRHYELKPGKNYGFLEGHVRFAMGQNPLMGTEDYYSLQFDSLVGVEGKTDCSDIPQSLIDELKDAERFDILSMAPAAQKNRVLAVQNFRKGQGRHATAATANSIGTAATS